MVLPKVEQLVDPPEPKQFMVLPKVEQLVDPPEP